MSYICCLCLLRYHRLQHLFLLFVFAFLVPVTVITQLLWYMYKIFVNGSFWSYVVGSSLSQSNVYSIEHYAKQNCPLPVEGLWFSACTPVSSTNENDRHDITQILFKVALNTTTITP